MKIVYGLIVMLLLSCGGQSAKKQATQQVAKTSFQTVDFNGLEDYLEKSKAAVHVVNFWATWCKPCVKELPHFEKVRAAYEGQDVKVILVSLDFPDQLDRLKTFIEKKNIRSEVVFLDDGDANSWIPKVDASWSGAIPATIIYNKEERMFYEQSFTYEELEKEINTLL